MRVWDLDPLRLRNNYGKVAQRRACEYLIVYAGFAISFQVSRKIHNPGHISIVSNAASDRKGPKHTGARIAWP